MTRITALILMICCLFSLSACNKEPVITKTSSIYQINLYVKDLTGIELNPYIAEAEMEIEKDDREYSRIKITLVRKTAPDVTKILKENTNIDDGPYIVLPDYKNHPYALEMKEKTITGHYMKVKQGKVMGSRDLAIYTAEDDKASYVFIFG